MKGVIQNEEYVKMALIEGREFVLVCSGESDANSKRVSLYNVRKRLSPADQRRIRIQKFKDSNGSWFVRISREMQEVMEVIGGEVRAFADSKELSPSSLKIIKEMLEANIDEEVIEITLADRGERGSSIRAAIKEIKQDLPR